ncbi:phage tail protein [Bradyrhizobium sp. HKCCYLS3077]|uniref:phage tail protein n=1 Tax=Bradyrhizobium sp. HKCCYLS3077 TaxID=3420761 RepID=UPI003EC0B767
MSDPFIAEIRLFAFPRVPDGWLLCDGKSLPISEYETLYTVIGTTYGGDGVQTFNTPDLRGRVPIGQGTGTGLQTYVIGQAAGEDEHSLNSNEIPSHSHSLLASTQAASTATPGPSVILGTASADNLYAPAANAAPYTTMSTQAVATAGQGLGHNNLMPTVVGNYCICYAGVFPSPG